MKKGLKKLKTGDFTHMTQIIDGSGVVDITLTSEKYSDVYRFKVRNLYSPGEKVLEETVTEGRKHE
jgi:hypothetical protein